MAVTVTARGLIVGVFRLLGITAQGEDPSAAELVEAFARLNELVDSWETQRLTMPTVGRHVFDLVSGIGTYTIGPDVLPPNFVRPRPATLDGVSLLLTNTSPVTEMPLSLHTERGWQGISQKSLTNTLPTGYTFTATMPAATLELWPVPTDASNDLVLYVPEALAQFATLTTAYTLAPGYVRALRYNLAGELAEEYGRPWTASLNQKAVESLSAIKQQNVALVDLALDPAFMGCGGGSYNILTDE